MNTAINHDIKIKKRIQLVHIAASELGFLDPKRHETDPEDDYHTILRRWNRRGTRQPVTSSLQMTYQQLGELLDFFKGLGFKLKKQGPVARVQGSESSKPRTHNPVPWTPKYPSSLQGLKANICDLARDRFGESWELPLNNFCRRFGIERWQWLDVSHGRAVKAALMRLERESVNACKRECENSASTHPRINTFTDSSKVPFERE